MKKIFSFFCALCLLLCCTLQAEAILGTYEQSVDWVKGKIGTSLDFDGKNGARCEDLIYAYYEHLAQTPVPGKACDYISNAIPSGWDRISANITPKPGDIAVYKTNLTSGGAQITDANGHVGVVTAVNSSTFSLVHQNYNGSGKCEEKSGVPVSYLACVIRPTFSEVSAHPGVICFWKPYPEKHSVGATNAVLASHVEINVDAEKISHCGIYLYDSNGVLLKSKTDTPQALGAYDCYVWFDVNRDLGKILCSGTQYRYKLFLIINGETHESPMYSFTTTGTHSVNGYCGGCDRVFFPDVSASDWYYNAVKFAVKKGYFTGHDSGMFGTYEPIKRQDFVLILSRIAGVDLENDPHYTGRTAFTDVRSNAYYAKAIQWATENEIIGGYNPTTFGTDDSLTREQLVTILYRYAKKLGVDVTVTTGWDLLRSYPDAAKPNPNLKEMVAWAVEKGVISGKQVDGKTCIAPRTSATRAETAQILLNISTKGIIPGI